ncbi:hypothetical protein JCM11641_002361 [Rhodosporidiobolus odoratus]
MSECSRVHPAPDVKFRLCEDSLLAVLDLLPARQLVQLRRVSLFFTRTIDALLRHRFLLLNASDEYVFMESYAPHETRCPRRQALSFSHFNFSFKDAYSGRVAHFKIAATPPPSYFFPLESSEQFTQNILRINLRYAPRPLNALADAARLDSGAQAAPALDSLPYFDFSLPIATSLNRIFRSYFETSPASEASSSSTTPSVDMAEGCSRSPTSPAPMSSRPTRTYRLPCPPRTPSCLSTLLGAAIDCVQAAAPLTALDQADADGSQTAYGLFTPWARYASRPASPAQLFEFTFSRFDIDVGKFVVAAEEGLPVVKQVPHSTAGSATVSSF